ncbi:MAG: hypothetical protein RJB13_167 [Pseudomonadota bacterium]
MTWKLPLNQVGSGRTYFLGINLTQPRHKEAELQLSQHPWLKEILEELGCVPNSNSTEQHDFSLVLNVEKQSDCFRVKVDLKMNPKLECIRSLTEFRNPVEVQAEAIYVQASVARQAGEHELSDGEMEAYEHDGNSLILSEFVTDLIYTSLPDFPLCQPDCKGLCAECGCNLNKTTSCAATQTAQSALEFRCPSHKFFN